MLKIHVPATELFDYNKERFYTVPECDLCLEHSLLSISKWESIHHKPLLEDIQLTNDELIDYIRCMTINRNVPDLVYNCLSNKQIAKIQDYMDDKMTATWFSENQKQPSNGQKITAELLYSWMIDLGIWKECEQWHIRKLLTLIRVRSEELKPKDKKSSRELASHYKNLKAARRAAKRKH